MRFNETYCIDNKTLALFWLSPRILVIYIKCGLQRLHWQISWMHLSFWSNYDCALMSGWDGWRLSIPHGKGDIISWGIPLKCCFMCTSYAKPNKKYFSLEWCIALVSYPLAFDEIKVKNSNIIFTLLLFNSVMLSKQKSCLCKRKA